MRWLVFALALVFPATAVFAQTGDDARYTIMVPEKGTKVKKPAHKEPAHKAHARRGSSVIVRPAPLPPPLHYRPPPSTAVTPPQGTVPPPLISPTGRALPNLPTVSPSGPNGTESYQDRAARCAHQAGVYGSAAGNRTGYINSCINQ